tara:strand:+ start:67 stop:216 length:150 start_codon:yes stop_codon:yes gene_type:complete
MNDFEKEENIAPPASSNEGSSSIRLAILGFLGTLLILAAMAIYWLIIRV